MNNKFNNTLNRLYNDIIGEGFYTYGEKKSWHHYGDQVVNSNGWTKCRYSKYATEDNGTIIENPEANMEPKYFGEGFDYSTKSIKKDSFNFWYGESHRWRAKSKPIKPKFGFFVNMLKYVENFAKPILKEDVYEKLVDWINKNGLNSSINVGSKITSDFLIQNFGSHDASDEFVDHPEILNVIWLPAIKNNHRSNSYTFPYENYLAVSRFPELFPNEAEQIKDAYLTLDPFFLNNSYNIDTVFENDPFFLKVAIIQHIDIRYLIDVPKTAFEHDAEDGHPMCEFLKIITENDEFPLYKDIAKTVKSDKLLDSLYDKLNASQETNQTQPNN